MVRMQLVLPTKVGAAIRMLPMSFYNTVQHRVGCTIILPDGRLPFYSRRQMSLRLERRSSLRPFLFLDYQLRQERIN